MKLRQEPADKQVPEMGKAQVAGPALHLCCIGR
jgi:hypothetical protein